MGHWLVGEYQDIDNGEILDVIGVEIGQPDMMRVLFHDGEDVMPRAQLEYQYELVAMTEQDWEELEVEAEDEGAVVLAHYRMIRARH